MQVEQKSHNVFIPSDLAVMDRVFRSDNISVNILAMTFGIFMLLCINYG